MRNSPCFNFIHLSFDFNNFCSQSMDFTNWKKCLERAIAAFTETYIHTFVRRIFFTTPQTSLKPIWAELNTRLIKIYSLDSLGFPLKQDLLIQTMKENYSDSDVKTYLDLFKVKSYFCRETHWFLWDLLLVFDIICSGVGVV